MGLDLQGPLRKGYVGSPNPVNSDLVGVGSGVDEQVLTTVINNITAQIMGLSNHTAGLPEVLTRLARDMSFAESSTSGVNTPNISFSAVNSERPVSIDFFETAAPYVTNDITDARDGLTVDVSGGFLAPSQVDALGGVALRSKLEISDIGAATNWRRVMDFTFQIASIAEGGPRYFLNLQRRQPEEHHRTLALTRVGQNIHLQARMIDPNNAATQALWTIPVGTRTLGTQPYHFQVGDIVRMVIEFEKTNVAVSDAQSDLRLIITAHRLDTNDNIIETIQFDDIDVVPNRDPNSAIHGYILGKVNEWNYDSFDYYAGDAANNFIFPTVGFEMFQWVETLTPRMFLHHTELASRSREGVTANHRLLGYYQEMLIDLFTMHAKVDLKASSTLGGKPLAKYDWISSAGADAALVIPEGFAGVARVDVTNNATAQATTLCSRSSVPTGTRIVVVREAQAANAQNVEISIPDGNDERIKTTDGTFAESFTLGSGQSSTIDYVEFVANEDGTDKNWLITHHYRKEAASGTASASVQVYPANDGAVNYNGGVTSLVLPANYADYTCLEILGQNGTQKISNYIHIPVMLAGQAADNNIRWAGNANFTWNRAQRRLTRNGTTARIIYANIQ